MYLSRAIETVINKAVGQSKIVLLTGARQVGKSTTVQNLFRDYRYVTLDNDNELMLAKRDPALFFQGRTFPVIIDEVQYAPELFRTIKEVADRENRKGLIVLTGSQGYELMSVASRFLAGRITIVEMPSLSLRELAEDRFNLPFLPTREYIDLRNKTGRSHADLWSVIHRGCMPETIDSTRDWTWFYRDYVKTYIERDISQIINLKDELKFRAFLVSLAARAAQILVCADVANDVGVDIKTVQSWLSVVTASGLVKLVQPYGANIVKRAIKHPKLFFIDTGLLCYLVGWISPETAKNGAMSGHIFENFVISEIMKSYMNAGLDTAGIYYYRDVDKHEIDLVIEVEGTLYPVEVKKGATVNPEWIKSFRHLQKIPSHTVGTGAVICNVDKPYPIDEKNTALPVEWV